MQEGAGDRFFFFYPLSTTIFLSHVLATTNLFTFFSDIVIDNTPKKTPLVPITTRFGGRWSIKPCRHCRSGRPATSCTVGAPNTILSSIPACTGVVDGSLDLPSTG